MDEKVKFTPEEALAKLRELAGLDDAEIAHALADEMLCGVLRFYGQDELVEVYDSIEKWFA